MSYILDALRKSENQRRLGQPPDLSAAPVPAGSANGHGPGRWRWFAAGGLLLILVAVAGLHWFGVLERPDSVQQPLVADQARPEPAESSPNPTEPTSIAGETATDEAAEEAEAMARASAPVVDRRSLSQRPATSISRPAPARPGAVATPPPVVPYGQRERLVTDPQEVQRLIEAQSQAASAAAAAQEGKEPAGRPDVADQTAPAMTDPAESDWAPDRSEYVEVWELPLAIRRELPELHLSIHVFSAEPAERFVLINGERRREGESLGDGARLSEISRSGAVVDFRDYRFLLKP